MDRRRPDRREPAPVLWMANGPRPRRPTPWERPASGLHTYAVGLTWRLVLTVLSYIVLQFVVETRSATLAKFVSLLLPLFGLGTGLVMLVGLARFARQPTDGRVRSSAVFAAALFGVTLAVEVVGFVLMLQLASPSTSDWWAVEGTRETAALANTVGVWAMALVSAHLLALLVSFHGLSRRLGQKRLATQTIGVGALMFMSASLVLVFKSRLARGDLEIGVSLALSAATLCVAISAIIIFIDLINVVTDNLLTTGERGLPTSQLSSYRPLPARARKARTNRYESSEPASQRQSATTSNSDPARGRRHLA